MKSYKEFSAEAEQLDEILGPAIRRGSKLLRGTAKNVGKLGRASVGTAGALGSLGLKGLTGAAGLAGNALKALLDGDKDESGQKVSDSKGLKAVEKHT